ncbi:MAG: hypothetical protein MUC28_01355 [Planctomycetes bacterium]|jgi:hypothetical protein|nr:hypothetical protein [Planctomycetota bacterium]
MNYVVLVVNEANGGLTPVEPGKFRVYPVARRQSIRQFVERSGFSYEAGRGFYELTKPEIVQGNKEIVLRDKKTGDLYAGAVARKLLGLPLKAGKGSIFRQDVKIGPRPLGDFQVFIQSTSYNRVLIPGTKLLYRTGR